MLTKRLFLLITSFAINTLGALPVGNPMDASLYTNGVCSGGSHCDPCDPCFRWNDQFQTRFGFYGDYVFNRKLAVEDGGAITQTKIMTNAGWLVLNFCNWVDIFGTLGGSKIDCFSSGSRFSTDQAKIQIDFEPYFSWSLGGRATLGHWRQFFLGIEAQFFRTRPDIHKFLRDRETIATNFSSKSKTVFKEWQVGLGISYFDRWIVPYAAFKVSKANLNMDDYLIVFQQTGRVFTLHDLVQQTMCGGAAGVTFVLQETAGITLEACFADETSFTFLCQIRF